MRYLSKNVLPTFIWGRQMRSHYVVSFEVDTWYPQLKDFTFKTEFLKLTLDEGKALGKYQDFRTHEDDKALRGLEGRIEKLISEYFPQGCFLVCDCVLLLVRLIFRKWIHVLQKMFRWRYSITCKELAVIPRTSKIRSCGICIWMN